MCHSTRKLLPTIASLLLLAVGLCKSAEEPQSLSPGRVEAIKALINTALEGTQDPDIDQLCAQVLPAFRATEKALATDKPAPLVTEAASEATAEQKVTQAALEAFPEYTPQELEQRAAELYPMYKPGERVTVIWRNSPKTTTTHTGTYHGMRQNLVLVDTRHILLSDMRGVANNDGPNGEIAKFDQKLNADLRSKWRREYISTSGPKRVAFIEENRPDFTQRQLQEDAALNEAHGWTLMNGQWYSPERLVHEAVSAAVAAVRRENAARASSAAALKAADADAQLAAAVLSTRLSGRTPLKVHAANAPAEEEKPGEDDGDIGIAPPPPITAEQILAGDSSGSPELDAPARKRLGAWFYIVVSAVVIIIAAVAIYKYNDREKELDVSSFFVGQGEVQKKFWEAADASPDTFKYVAYLFPTLEQAQKALVQLSFISIDEHGIIQAKRGDLEVGAYDHQGRAVAFIGGEKLNYARWREANMTWPELPGAAYFKVSSDPEVHLEIPDFSQDADLNENITQVGSEDIRGESGEITHVIKFNGDSREHAIAFLEKFNLEEEGIMVQVETPEGIFAKDTNGIFTA